jgi:hypothetical protein
MPKKTKQKNKVQYRKRSETITTLNFLAENDSASIKDDKEMERGETGMLLEKEDVRLIYNALKAYTPTKDEEVLHSTLLESFEETLVVDYGEDRPDVM